MIFKTLFLPEKKRKKSTENQLLGKSMDGLRLYPKAKRPTRAILKRIHENAEKLGKSLDEQEKTILHSIQDDRLKLAAIVGEKRFWEAFTLGARLAIEMLAGKLDTQYSDNME